MTDIKKELISLINKNDTAKHFLSRKQKDELIKYINTEIKPKIKNKGFRSFYVMRSRLKRSYLIGKLLIELDLFKEDFKKEK
jgi:hypothetical protein